MAAHRIYSRLNTFFGLQGQLLAGGYLKFYTEETTTPKDVYGDEALTVNNGSQVDLDASGRPEEDIWGDGDYFVELYDADDVKQGDMDNVAIYGGGGLTIPALASGEFLTNNGTVLQWDSIIQVPDPTGQSGKILGNNGTSAIWQAPAEAIEPEITVDEVDKEFIAGVSSDDTKFVTLSGTSTAPASGGRETTKAIVFSTAFNTLQHVAITITADGLTAYNDCPRIQLTSQSVTGFTVRFNTGENSTASGWDITSDVPFSWIAFGTREIP